MGKVEIRFRKPFDCYNYITEEDEIEVFDVKNMETIVVNPQDSAGYRMVTRLDRPKEDSFDNEWIKLGYAWSCQGGYDATKKDNNKGIPLRMPSKDSEIREFFGYTDKKCIYWTNEYDLSEDKILSQKKYHSYKDAEWYDREIPDDKLNSFMRGLFSACGCVNLKNKIVSAPLQLFYAEDKEESSSSSQIDGGKIGTSYEHNGDRVYISDKAKLEYFYKNIGFIQKSKMDDLELVMQARNPKMIKPNIIK